MEEKITKCTTGWSHKFLTEAGKEILLKSVALALPVYTMNVFRLPKGTTEAINKILSDYWWSKGSGKRSMHWIAWQRLGLPKNEGGLVFRDLDKFNLALLGKQAWRIM